MTAAEIQRKIRYHAEEIVRLSALVADGALSAPAEELFNKLDGNWMEGSRAEREWSCSPATLARWRKANLVSARMHGGRWFFDRRKPPTKPR
jgi:hypothetical protein